MSLESYLTASKDTDVFPESSWAEQRTKYDEYLRYFSGKVWETLAENIQVEGGQKPLRWPVKINLIKILSLMHAMTLWGEWKDEIISFRFEPKDPSEYPKPGARSQEETAKEIALGGQRLVNSVWAENNRETLLIEQSVAAQPYGGCVFRLRRNNAMRHGIGIEYLSPYYFQPVWNPVDFHQLLAARVCFEISSNQAALLYGEEYRPKRRQDRFSGVVTYEAYQKTDKPQVSSETVLYEETWTERQFSITVGGKPLIMNGRSYYQQENPYGVIPFVYIPRLRMESFYGSSLCEDLMGLQDELNDRVADIGDQILNECHATMVLTNFTGDLRKLKPSPSGILNLGMQRPGFNPPVLDRVPAGDIPQGAFQHINFLLDTAKMAAFTPPVAFGLDEGSQRSGVTLIIRMWPLLQQAKWSRAWWDDGFRDVNKLILTMLRAHSSEDYDERFEGHRVRAEWAPIQPRDREALIQELVQLASADLQSLETMVERLGDTQDRDEEIAKIKAWIQTKRRIERGAEEVGPQRGGEVGSTD